jgi:predicted enzyme related to lactoylglutathione lyase
MSMFIGVHAVLWTDKADEMRAFFRDQLEVSSVDLGGGWLAFALPPAEIAMHPSDEQHAPGSKAEAQLYFLCEDIEQTVGELEAKGVEIAHSISDEGYGLTSAIKLPDGQELGIYQPRHPLAWDQASG